MTDEELNQGFLAKATFEKPAKTELRESPLRNYVNDSYGFGPIVIDYESAPAQKTEDVKGIIVTQADLNDIKESISRNSAERGGLRITFS